MFTRRRACVERRVERASALVSGDDRAEPLRWVCSRHAGGYQHDVAVVAAESSSRDGHSYPPVPASVRSARELVRETLRLHGVESGVAQILVSELAANAVRHARTDFTVRISVGDVVRIEVGDGELTLEGLQVAPERTRPDKSGEEAEARAEPEWPERTRPEKLGLRLVDAFADRWGVDLVPTGKRIWCELDAARLGSTRTGRAAESARR